MLEAKDVMTVDVISVQASSSVRAVAELLVEHGISAVPVVEAGQLVGIVSEGDLVRRSEIGTSARARSWWADLFRSSASIAAEYVKQHSTRISDVMTADVVTVAPSTPLDEIARLLEEKQIKRVPVMRDGKLVGIVSRANVVRALAIATSLPANVPDASDAGIRDLILEALRNEAWASAGAVELTVSDGVVSVWGTVQSEEEQRAFLVLCENIQGVKAVEDHRMPLEFPIVAV